MSERKLLHMFAYDIGSDRIRRKTGEALEDWGVRVQRSVFEIRATRGDAQKLARRLAVNLADTDSLRVYPLSDDLRLGSLVFGSPPISEAEDFWLV